MLIAHPSRYFSIVKGAFALITLMGVCRIACSLCFIYASKSVIDIATGVSMRDFSFWAAVMASAIISDLTLSAVASKVEKLTSQRVQNSLRRKLCDHLLSVVWTGRKTRHSADAINRLERDVRDVAEFFSTQLPSLVIAGLQFCAAFTFLLFLDPRLGWMLVGVLPLFLIISKLWYVKLKRLTHNVRNSDSRIQAHLQDSIVNQVVIKTHGAERATSRRLDSLHDMLMGQTISQTQFTFYSRLILSLGFAAGYLLTFIYGAWQIREGLITYGVMVAFLQLVAQIQRPVAQLASGIPQFSTAATASERLDELFGIQTETRSDATRLDGVVGVDIQGVDFAYDDDSRKIFCQFTHQFSPSSRTIVTGVTGAGKSTLLRLMLSLVRPSGGSITIFNERGDRMDVDASTRVNFVYVPQGNSLFSGSVRSNLLLSNPLATDAQLRQALTTAVAEFVYDLPQGVDTECAEGGVALSEGQAQRIAVARALLGEGSVMLFDEFTSALDHATENELITRLSANYMDRTMIFITHRPEVFSSLGFDNCIINSLTEK